MSYKIATLQKCKRKKRALKNRLCEKNIRTIFQKMKGKLPADQREKFVLEIWDDTGLLKVERELGLKI